MKRILMSIALITCIAFGVSAQATFKSTFNATQDTVRVTNGETAYLYLQKSGTLGISATTIFINVTEVSGTTGGTITLQGSDNGTDWYAVNTEGSQTAIATITPTDVTTQQNFSIRLNGYPFSHWRLRYVGTGTMVDTAKASLISR
jgi:hypothetical protein